MVFKFLQTFPLGLKGFAFQVLYGLLLFILVYFFGLSRIAFFTGFVFANFYMLLFFYSASLLFKKKRRALAFLILSLKWLSLLVVLIAVLWFLDGKAFLIGLSSILTFLLFYVLQNMFKTRWKKEKAV